MLKTCLTKFLEFASKKIISIVSILIIIDQI